MANTIKTRSEPKEIMGLNRITKKRLLELCKKDKLYQTPSLNDVLYLHYQGFQCIECLDDYTELKCLWLECNAISEIQGLENQTKLKCLYLQSNLIKKIENLECCKELDTINLSQNHIRKIENIGDNILPVLNTLNISSNYISDSEGLRELENCRNLSVLDLSNNRIDDILVVKIFAKMPELKVLVLQGNPVVSKIPQYRKTLILECKNLTYLDSRPVFPKDRACAEAWKRGGYEEERKESERWNRKERRKMRDSVNATIRMRNKFRKPEDHLTLLVSSDSEDEAAKTKRKRQLQEPDTGVDMELGIWEEVAGDDNKSETTSSSDMNTSSSTSVISTTDSNDVYSSSNSKCSTGQDVLNNTNANEEKVLDTSEKGDNRISVLAERQSIGDILKFINDKNQTEGLDKNCMVEDQNEERETTKKDDVMNDVDKQAEEQEIVETVEEVRLEVCQLKSTKEGFGEQNGGENKEEVLPEATTNLKTTDLVEAEGINIIHTTRDSLDSDDDHTPTDYYKPTLDAICRVTTNDLNQPNVDPPRRVYLQIETNDDNYEPYIEMEKVMQTMTKQEYTDGDKSGEAYSNLDNLKIETNNSQSQLEYDKEHLGVNTQLKFDFEQMSSSMDIHMAQLQRDKEERREVLEALFSQKEATKETSSGSSDTEAECAGNERRFEGIIQQWDRETKLKSKDKGSAGDTLEMELMTHILKQKLSKETPEASGQLNEEKAQSLIKDQTTEGDNTQNVSRESDVSAAICERKLLISVKNICEEPDKGDPLAFSYELSEKRGNSLESFHILGEIKSELTEIENVAESATSVYEPFEERTQKLVLNIPIPSCADLNDCEPKIIVVKNVCEKPDKGDPQAFSNEISEKFADFEIFIGKTASEKFVNTGEIKSELVERENVGESKGNFYDSYQESSKNRIFKPRRETKNTESQESVGRGYLGCVSESDIEAEFEEMQNVEQSAAKEMVIELGRETEKIESQKAKGEGCRGGVFEADIEEDPAERRYVEDSAAKELHFELEMETNKIESGVPEADLNYEPSDIALLTQASNQALDSFEREAKELKNLLQKLENENEELFREINAESKCEAEESKQEIMDKDLKEADSDIAVPVCKEGHLDDQCEISAERKFEAEESSQKIKVNESPRQVQDNKESTNSERLSGNIKEDKETSNNNNISERERKNASGKNLKEISSDGKREEYSNDKEQEKLNLINIEEIDREKFNQRNTGEIDEERISQESSPNSKAKNRTDHEIHLGNREEDIKQMCEETARDIIESLTLKPKRFSFPALESHDDHVGGSLPKKDLQSSDLPLCKTIHGVIESLSDIFKDRCLPATKRPRVATTKAEKAASLKHLAEQPNLNEFNKDTHESLDKLLDEYKRQQSQEIQQMVDRVYKQKERYDDTIELIEGKLMVVNKDTGELKELPAAPGRYVNASDEDYDTAESADEGACCTSKPRTGSISKGSAVERNWSKRYGQDYETAGSADEGACCSKPRTGNKARGSAMERSWPKSYGPKSRGFFGEMNFSQVDNLENEESDDEEFYSLDTQANVYGDIDNEFFDKLSFQHLEFSQQDSDHMVQCSRSYEELKSYLTVSKEERHLTADESDLLEAMLERITSRTNNEELNNVKELRKAEDALLMNMLQRTKEKDRMRGLALPSKQEFENERNTSYGPTINEFLKLFEFSPETEKLLLIDNDPEMEEETDEETADETDEGTEEDTDEGMEVDMGMFGQGIYTFIHNDLKEKNIEFAKLHCEKKEDSQNFSKNSQIWQNMEIPSGQVLNASNSKTMAAAAPLTRDEKVDKKEDNAMWQFSLPLIDKDNSQNFSENSQIWNNIQIPGGEVLNSNKAITNYDKKEDIWQYSPPPRCRDSENSLNFPKKSQISYGEVLNASNRKTYAAAEQLTRAEKYNRKEDIWQYSPPRSSNENSLNFPENSQIWKNIQLPPYGEVLNTSRSKTFANAQLPPRDSYLNTYPTDNDDEERVLAKIRNSRILWENPEPEIPNQSLYFPCLSKPLGDCLFPLGNHFPVNQINSTTKIAEENVQQSLNKYKFYNSGRMEITSDEAKTPKSESLFDLPSTDICEKLTNNVAQNIEFSHKRIAGFYETPSQDHPHDIPNGKSNIIQNSSSKPEKINLILNSDNPPANGNIIPNSNTQPEFIPDIRENNISINACATKETPKLETLFTIPDSNYCGLKTDSELILKDNSPVMNDEISSENDNKIPKTDMDEILPHGLNETSSRKNIIPNSDISKENDIFEKCEGFSQPEDIIAIRKYIIPINSWAEETLKSETLYTIQNADILEEMASNFSDSYRLKNDFEFTLSGNLPVIYEVPNSDIEAENYQSNLISGYKENNLQINTAENISDYSKEIFQPGIMPDSNEHNPPINSSNLQNLASLPKDIPTNSEPNFTNPSTSQNSVTDSLANKEDSSPSRNFQVIPDMAECSGENPQLGSLPKDITPNTEPNSLTNPTTSQNLLTDFLVTIQDCSPSRNFQVIPDMTEYSDEIPQTEFIPVNNAQNPPINPEAYISSYIKAMSQSLCKPKFESEGIWVNTGPKSHTNLSDLQIPDSDFLCNTKDTTPSSNDKAKQNAVIATDIAGYGKVIPQSEFIPPNYEENPQINPEAEISNNSKTISNPERKAVNNEYNSSINPDISQKVDPEEMIFPLITEPKLLTNTIASQNQSSELLFPKQDNIPTRSYNLIQNSGIEADMSECGKIILQPEFLPNTNENNSPKKIETDNCREIILQPEIISDNKENNHLINPAADISYYSKLIPQVEFLPGEKGDNLEINSDLELEDILPNSQSNSHTNSTVSRNPDSDLQDEIPTPIAKVILNSVVEADISGYSKETPQTEIKPVNVEHNSLINPETYISDYCKLNTQSELIPENEEYNLPINADTSEKPVSLLHNRDPNNQTNPFASANPESKQKNEVPSPKIEIIYNSAIQLDMTDYDNAISQPQFIPINNAHNLPINPEPNIFTSDKAANPKSEFIPNNNEHNPPIHPDNLPKQISKVENPVSKIGNSEYNAITNVSTSQNPDSQPLSTMQDDEMSGKCDNNAEPSLDKQLSDDIATNNEENSSYNVQNSNTLENPASKIDSSEYNPITNIATSSNPYSLHLPIMQNAEILKKMSGKYVDINAEPSVDKLLSDTATYICTNTKTNPQEDNTSITLQNTPKNPGTSQNPDTEPLASTTDVDILECNLEILECNEDVIDTITVNAELHYNF